LIKPSTELQLLIKKLIIIKLTYRRGLVAGCEHTAMAAMIVAAALYRLSKKGRNDLVTAATLCQLAPGEWLKQWFL